MKTRDTESAEDVASSGEPPGTPEQTVSAPASAAWRPRRGRGADGDCAPSVHWDSDVEANHTPGGSRRLRMEPSLARRMWDSLPSAAASVAASATAARSIDAEGYDDKSEAWNWRKAVEGWELVAAFAAALMLVNGIAFTHAAGPGITFFRGVTLLHPCGSFASATQGAVGRVHAMLQLRRVALYAKAGLQELPQCGCEIFNCRGMFHALQVLRGHSLAVSCQTGLPSITCTSTLCLQPGRAAR